MCWNSPGYSTKLRNVLGDQLPNGNILEPSLSYDAKRVVFSFVACEEGQSHDPAEFRVNEEGPDDRYFHVYQVDVDGTNLRQLTSGCYDDLMPTYLPDGDIAFCSTRRKGYSRCFGPEYSDRWDAYTMHRMAADGSNIRRLSANDVNEWFPSVSNQGELLFARWDYIDRDAVTHQNLWAMLQRIKEHGKEAVFGEVLIPTETVQETRGDGKQRIRQKTSLPGYIFVEMDMSEEAWHLVKDTPKVTGFIGNQRPQEVPSAGDRGPAPPHRRGRRQAEAARELRRGRRDPRHRRRVRELLRHGRRSEARQAEAQGEGLDLRPRHAGRARLRPGREALSAFGRANRGPDRVRHGPRRVRRSPRQQRDLESRRAMKKITGYIKLQLPAGKANPAPPVGPALGQHGVNIMGFCKEFNAKTAAQGDMIIPVVITVYSDRSFTFITEDAARVSVLLKKAAGLATGKKPGSGSKEPNKNKVGKVTEKQVRELAEQKIQDMNCTDSRRPCAPSRHRALDGHRHRRLSVSTSIALARRAPQRPGIETSTREWFARRS